MGTSNKIDFPKKYRMTTLENLSVWFSNLINHYDHISRLKKKFDEPQNILNILKKRKRKTLKMSSIEKRGMFPGLVGHTCNPNTCAY